MNKTWILRTIESVLHDVFIEPLPVQLIEKYAYRDYILDINIHLPQVKKSHALFAEIWYKPNTIYSVRTEFGLDHYAIFVYITMSIITQLEDDVTTTPIFKESERLLFQSSTELLTFYRAYYDAMPESSYLDGQTYYNNMKEELGQWNVTLK